MKKSVIACLALLLLSAFVATEVAAQGAISSPPVAQLFVRGEAQLIVPPDQVSVVLGITTESAKTRKAMADNSRKMQALIRELQALGLTEKDYKTQNFRVQPVWSSRPKGAGSEWRSRIIAYRVSNSLLVTTPALKLIGDIIASAAKAGANQVNSVSFSLSNERQYRQQAITQAMENAKQDAQTLVMASGDKIKRTLSLNLDNSSASKVRVEASSKMRTFASAQADIAPPPISGGDITVRASVSVVYELESPAL